MACLRDHRFCGSKPSSVIFITSSHRGDQMSVCRKERMDKALEQLKTISGEDFAKVKGPATSSGRSGAYCSRLPMITA